MRKFKRSIAEMQQLAQNNGGECLSKTYAGVECKLVWVCQEGHIWDALPSSIQNGHWCAKCGHSSAAQKRIKLTIQVMRDVAAQRNGLCLSKKYLGLGVHLLWQCQDGHQWKAVPNNILYNKRWCPKCAKRKHFTEEKCRFIIEQMTGLKFPSDRKVLGNGQELDLYNSKHRVAIEYNGIQHYKMVKSWHKDEAGFEQGQERDRRKSKLCDEIGIDLFIVSYKYTRRDERLIARIKEIVAEADLSVVRQDMDLTTFYDNLSTLKELNNISTQQGGKCLSREYINCETKLQFQCAKGHVFEMEPRHVKSGHWCNECGNAIVGDKNRKLSLEDAQEEAEGRGGKCLSTMYQGTHHKLKWQCKEGHIWESPFGQIREGRWCNLCGYQAAGKKMRATLKSVQNAAEKRGGRCISTDYVNNRTKLEFECAQSHRWWARPGNIKSGKWCPQCAWQRV